MCDDTGEHSTTRLCLQWLFDRRDKILGAHVMDYGTGSGVLAVAALLMGAASAVRHRNDIKMEVNQQPVERYQKLTCLFICMFVGSEAGCYNDVLLPSLLLTADCKACFVPCNAESSNVAAFHQHGC